METLSNLSAALGCRHYGLRDFYAISYLYFGALSTGASVLVGSVVSYLTGETATPSLHRMLDILFKFIFIGIMCLTMTIFTNQLYRNTDINLELEMYK